MKRAISFSFYGNDLRYLVGAALDKNDTFIYPSDRELSYRESGIERFPTEQ